MGLVLGLFWGTDRGRSKRQRRARAYPDFDEDIELANGVPESKHDIVLWDGDDDGLKRTPHRLARASTRFRALVTAGLSQNAGAPGKTERLLAATFFRPRIEAPRRHARLCRIPSVAALLLWRVTMQVLTSLWLFLPFAAAVRTANADSRKNASDDDAA
ncbi:hypothetical protein M885DRAFT_509629 [Pelagophyceae sp. CCMP2097]|nr:hypothetical protein M885DRAFT_509629 [Pelagophyceae sp. CCMP2097]